MRVEQKSIAFGINWCVTDDDGKSLAYFKSKSDARLFAAAVKYETVYQLCRKLAFEAGPKRAKLLNDYGILEHLGSDNEVASFKAVAALAEAGEGETT